MSEENKFKIVITEYDFKDVEIEKKTLEELDCEIVETHSDDEEVIIRECANADALLIEFAPITEKVINSLNKCRVISRYGIGVDTVDLNAAKSKGILVCNVPDYCLEEVAEHCLALILSSGRKIVNLSNSVKKGIWDVTGVGRPIYNFKDSILGIIGFGKIPQSLYSKVLPLFKNILVYDPYVKEEFIKEKNINISSFYKILRNSDFISINCPLNDDTYHMFDEREFQTMRLNSFIVNTSRGGIINTEALYKALVNGQIAGAALDVLEKEPPGMDLELLKLDNVIITPHAGWYSETSIEELKYKTALNVLKVLKGEEPINVINK